MAYLHSFIEIFIDHHELGILKLYQLYMFEHDIRLCVHLYVDPYVDPFVCTSIFPSICFAQSKINHTDFNEAVYLSFKHVYLALIIKGEKKQLQ